MPDAIVASLASVLKPSIPEAARSLGEPEDAVSRGFELATAAVFEGLTRKTNDPATLRRVIELASNTPVNLVSKAVSSGQLANQNSPLITDGKRLLSTLVGNREDALLASVSRESGLRGGSTSTVLAVAAQFVLSFLGTRVRDEGITRAALPGFLHSSAVGFRNSWPLGFRETFAIPPAGVREPIPVIDQVVETEPAVFQTERKERSFLPWLLVSLLLILLGLLWYAFRSHRPLMAETPAPRALVAKTPAPVAPATPDLGNPPRILKRIDCCKVA